MSWHAFWLLALILVPAGLTASLSVIPGLRALPAWVLVGIGLGLFFAGVKVAVMVDDARRRDSAGRP